MIDAALARRIRVVSLDVDGVLTDGGIYLGDVAGARHEFKRYDIQDGLGIYLMRSAGVVPAIVTGRVSMSVELRARELAIEHVAQDAAAQKLAGLMTILETLGVGLHEVAHIGDDFPDLPILRRVALPVAVRNAAPEILAATHLHLSRMGGRGAVREFAELLLKARDEWNDVVERYVAERTPDQPAAVRT